MSKKKDDNDVIDIYEELKEKDEEFNNYETVDQELKLSPLALIYVAISLVAIIGITLYGNGTGKGAELSWLRYALCGQLFAGIGVILFRKSKETSSEAKNKYSGVMLIIAGIIVVILGILKKVLS